MDPVEELFLLKILGLNQDKLGPEGLHLGWEVFTPLAPVHILHQSWDQVEIYVTKLSSKKGLSACLSSSGMPSWSFSIGRIDKDS